MFTEWDRALLKRVQRTVTKIILPLNDSYECRLTLLNTQNFHDNTWHVVETNCIVYVTTESLRNFNHRDVIHPK